MGLDRSATQRFLSLSGMSVCGSRLRLSQLELFSLRRMKVRGGSESTAARGNNPFAVCPSMRLGIGLAAVGGTGTGARALEGSKAGRGAGMHNNTKLDIPDTPLRRTSVLMAWDRTGWRQRSMRMGHFEK